MSGRYLQILWIFITHSFTNFRLKKEEATNSGQTNLDNFYLENSRYSISNWASRSFTIPSRKSWKVSLKMKGYSLTSISLVYKYTFFSSLGWIRNLQNWGNSGAANHRHFIPIPKLCTIGSKCYEVVFLKSNASMKYLQSYRKSGRIFDLWAQEDGSPAQV